jgi:hypothetical protein
LARKANYTSFEALGIQNLGASANLTFSQQTFAESLKLPFPLLSDFPERKVMRAYRTPEGSSRRDLFPSVPHFEHSRVHPRDRAARGDSDDVP